MHGLEPILLHPLQLISFLLQERGHLILDS